MPKWRMQKEAVVFLRTFLDDFDEMAHSLKPILLRAATNARAAHAVADARAAGRDPAPAAQAARDAVKKLEKERKGAREPGALPPVTVMVTNAGMVDLVANWLCAARAPGVPAAVRASAESVVVFATDRATQAALDALGVATFSHAGLGELPAESAAAYGDRTFVRMMWLKVCVFLGARRRVVSSSRGRAFAPRLRLNPRERRVAAFRA